MITRYQHISFPIPPLPLSPKPKPPEGDPLVKTEAEGGPDQRITVGLASDPFGQRATFVVRDKEEING